jgi:hypothetical protein
VLQFHNYFLYFPIISDNLLISRNQSPFCCRDISNIVFLSDDNKLESQVGVPINFRPLAPQALDGLRRFSSTRPPMAEANSQIADPSVRGIRISDLITGRPFTAKCGDGRAITGTADVHAFYSPSLDTVRHPPKSRVIIKLQVRPPLPSGSPFTSTSSRTSRCQ